MDAVIERDNITVGMDKITHVTEKKAWRQEQQRTFGKALGVAKQVSKEKEKILRSELYSFYQVYVHEAEGKPPTPLVSTASGAPVATAAGAALLGISPWVPARLQRCRTISVNEELTELEMRSMP